MYMDQQQADGPVLTTSIARKWLHVATVAGDRASPRLTGVFCVARQTRRYDLTGIGGQGVLRSGSTRPSNTSLRAGWSTAGKGTDWETLVAYPQGRGTTCAIPSSWHGTRTSPFRHARLFATIMLVARAVEACGLHQVLQLPHYDGGQFSYLAAGAVLFMDQGLNLRRTYGAGGCCPHAPKPRTPNHMGDFQSSVNQGSGG